MGNLAASPPSPVKNSEKCPVITMKKMISMTSFVFEKWLHYCHFRVRTTSNEIMGAKAMYFSPCMSKQCTQERVLVKRLKGPRSPPHMGKHISIYCPP